MKKIKFIYNPISGNAKNPKILDTIISVYQSYKKVIVPFRINNDSSLEDAFLDLDESYDHILIAGGDGTVNRVLNIYMQKKIKIPIAILPTGTANDFAKLLEMPLDIEKACHKILNSRIRYVDIGKVNKKYFINILSFGLFTEVSQKTPTYLKNNLGKLAYYLSGIKEIKNLKKIDLVVEYGKTKFSTKCFLVFVFNGKTAGNIKISYKSKIDDGLLDVILIKGESFLSSTSLLYNFFKKEHLEKINKDELIYLQTSSTC